MRSPRYPVSKKGVVVIPPGDSYYAELAVLVRNVEALPDNAPITDVLKAHTELSDFVRRTARERVSYAEYVMRLEFRDGETTCARKLNTKNSLSPSTTSTSGSMPTALHVAIPTSPRPTPRS